jgi:hypothetical protein
LESLERLLNNVDENFDMRPLHEMFDLSIAKARLALAAEQDQDAKNKDYVRLRKVTITPSRRIFESPELIMGKS